jgi:putative inorganic carbon (HCO3(-)) transporter
MAGLQYCVYSRFQVGIVWTPPAGRPGAGAAKRREMQKKETLIVAGFGLLTIIVAGLALLSLKIALVAVVGITAALVIFFKPFYGLIIYLVLLYIRPQDFVPALERLRIMLILATAIIVIFFIHQTVRRARISIFGTRQNILMFLLLVIVPFSDIVNGRFAESYDGLNEFLTVFLLFFLIVNIVDDEDKFRKVCWVLVSLTVLISINGIIMHFQGTGLAGSTPVEGTRVRWIGIFGDPNDYALVINSFFPFLLVTLFDKTVSKWARFLILIGVLISVLTLYYTNSRGGFLAFLCIIGIFSVKRWGLLKGMAVGAIFLAAGIAMAPSRMGNLSPYEVSAAGRVNSWIDGLVYLKLHPLFGIGFQNFGEYSTLAAHSAFIKCMAELGGIGYFMWMALLYTSYTDVMKVSGKRNGTIVQKRNVYERYADILQLSLIGFVASAVFLSQTFMPVLYILVALSTLASHNPLSGLKFPSFLSGGETWRIILLMGASILGYKLLAMLYM